MDFVFKHKRISGILTVLPQKSVKFEDEMANYNFSPAKCMKLKIAMGYNEHRIAAEGQTSADFCEHGLRYLVDNKLLNPNDVDALLFVSQSPDYFLPPQAICCMESLECDRIAYVWILTRDVPVLSLV